MKSIKNLLPMTLLLTIGAATFSWALYRLIYEILGDGLSILGITNSYLQNIIIIVGVGVLLVLGGKKLSKLI